MQNLANALMSPAIDPEIVGDWNNIRGTEYHFVYALWLILKHQSSVVFYKGNDLLAKVNVRASIAPKFDTEQIGDSPPAIELLELSPDFDQWIQLKATRLAWTVSEVLAENDYSILFATRSTRSLDRDLGE